MRWKDFRQSENVQVSERVEHPVLGEIFNLRAFHSGEWVESIPEHMNQICLSADVARMISEGAIQPRSDLIPDALGVTAPPLDTRAVREAAARDSERFTEQCTELREAFQIYSRENGLHVEERDFVTPAPLRLFMEGVPETHPGLIARPDGPGPRR